MTSTKYQVVCSYMHYTQVLAESTDLSQVTDVYKELRSKAQVKDLTLQKVVTTVEVITIE